MKTKTLHDELVVFDGLIVSNWDRKIFEDMKAGGVTAANCTCAVWEDFRGTMQNVAQWHQWFEEFSDILIQVRKVADIRRAKTEGKVGIALGWQNTSPIEGQLEFLNLFHKYYY